MKQILNSNGQEFLPTRVSNAPKPVLNQQLIKRSVNANSLPYYQKFLQTVLYLAEEEFTFTKYLNFMHNGLKFGKVVINSTKMLAVR